jgi:hypothetical protein
MIEISTRDIIVISIALAGATAMAMVLYRRTRPALPRRLRIFLGILRWIAAFMVLLLVTDPVVSLVRTAHREPTVAVLVDASRSMAYPGADPKIGRARTAVADDLLDRLGQKADVRLFRFSETAEELTLRELRELEANGSRTDLAAALRSVSDRLDARPSAFVVLSDGAVNFGEDPVYLGSSLRVPIHVVSAASEVPTPDVSIDYVDAPGMAYAGTDVHVAVYLSGRHASPVETTLDITDSTGTVYSSPVVIPGTGARQKVVAHVPAGALGMHSFKAELASFEGESVVTNNGVAFSVEILKGKVRVAVVAPYPSWDFAFAKRTLEADPNMDVSVVFPRQGQPPVRLDGVTSDLGDVIDNLDVIVVMRDADLGTTYQRVKDFVWSGGGLIFLSGGISQAIFAELGPFVLQQGAGSVGLLNPVVTDAGRDHPITGIDAGNEIPWAGLPPVPVGDFIKGARQQATVLVSGQLADTSVPLVAVMRHGRGRIVGFSAFDLWRWDLVPQGFHIDAAGFTRLLLGSVGWLTERQDIERLSVSAPKTTYMWGEPVDLLARVGDENLKPVAGSSVEITLVEAVSGLRTRQVTMISRGAGSHSLRLDLLEPGTYLVEALARIDDEAYAEASLEFAVDERGLEDSGFDGDKILLNQIATATGGEVHAIDDAALLADEINPGSIVLVTTAELRLPLTLATFLVLAGLLGVEWFIRKRRMLL